MKGIMKTYIVDKSFSRSYELVLEFLLNHCKDDDLSKDHEIIFDKVVYIRELLACAEKEWQNIKKIL